MPWPVEPLEVGLPARADAPLSGPDAVLVIDDTLLPKQAKHLVGVARQCCGPLGRRMNHQVLVSLTLTHNEVPAPVALRLYLPEGWCTNAERRRRARVPEDLGHRPKWRFTTGSGPGRVASGPRDRRAS